MKYSVGTVVILWITQLICGVLLLQAAYFKFVQDPGSIALFQALDMGVISLYIIAALELVAALMIVSWKLSGTGSILAMGIMTGALIAHVVTLGIDIQAGLAVLILASALTVFVIRRKEIPVIGTTL